MAATVEELTSRQKDSFEKIKQICVNVKKDGASRKTIEYLDKRYNDLKAYWQEFDMNHQILMKLDDKNIEYFTEDGYNKTKMLCDETVAEILKLKTELMFQNVKQNPAATSTKSSASSPENQTQTDSTKNKRQDLLRYQQCNFKVLRRALSKIDTGTMTEKWELEDSLSNIKSKWDTIEKTHFELDYISQETDYFYEQEYTELEKTYEHTKKLLNQKNWNSVHYEKSTPRLEIPDYHGNYTQWISFKDLFVESIHSNPLLAKTQKMQHLKTKLKGEAEKLIQHLPISAENYDACWEILTHRYDNRRLLFTSYMNSLLNQPILQQGNAYNIKKLHDTTSECLKGLTNIGLEITTSDPVLAYLIMKKLDSDTYAEYIKDLKAPREVPDLKELMHFLESKFIALEALHNDQNSRSFQPQKKYNVDNRNMFSHKTEKVAKSYHTTFTKYCPLCKSDGHVLMQCDKFVNMNNATRNNTVTQLRVCKNCLFSHNMKACNSEKRCKICNKAHHTLLHYNGTDISAKQPNQQPTVNNITDERKEILLTTIQLKVKNVDRNYVTLRALLDQGSQVSLITENAAQLLRLPRSKLSAIVSGVGNIQGNCKGVLHLECKSIHSNFTFETKTLIINKLINNLPAKSFSTDNWNYLNNIKLADPEFNISGPIDLLLGADVYSELILDGVMKSDSNYPIAQQTNVGWILCGNVQTFNCCITLNELENITQFWETEDITKNNNELTEQDYCEKYFLETTERQQDGKYVVKMPMKPNYQENLGNSKPQAISQFLQLEKRMEKQKYFASQYKNFIKEYIELEHMKLASPVIGNQPQAFLPHHGVMKKDSTTTSLRVVFNGSMKTSTKYSLNDLMHTGPNLQKDILSLIIQWRTHKYAFTADVEKMYRNIMLHKDQQQLQKIIWRDSPQEPLKEMRLCTLTYGLTVSPYLALRTLHQLARDDGHKYPEAAKVLENYFYMDDLVCGRNTIDSAKQLTSDLIALMKMGGFNLRKWTSNDPAILEGLTEEQKSQKNVVNFKNDQSSNTKTLGLNWNPTEDYFYFELSMPDSRTPLTKRILLSEISSLYDPLGWLSPTIIKSKLLFQKLWTDNLGWDETVPSKIANEWENLKADMDKIKQIKLRRWLYCNQEELILHGFCDASGKAYSAVVYSQTTNESGEPIVTLIAAKTKVAPLKSKITLPQMELCGALLLAKLLEKINNALGIKKITYNCWTDSKVVLAWLQRNTQKSERYIANRVKQINNIIPVHRWKHVKGEENPADCATRGLLPSKLLSFNLWWEGPLWLKTYSEEKTLENKETFYTEIGIQNNCFATNTNSDTTLLSTLLSKHSTLSRVIRVVSWVRRFISVLRNKYSNYEKYLSKQEILETTEIFIKHVQEQYFRNEIDQLKKSETLPSRSNLLKLNPFLDKGGILRVGGRLRNSTLSYEAKHPIILPHGKFAELVIDYYHKLTLHGGARLTLSRIRETYWILGGNKTVKKQLRQCVKCHRFAPHKSQQIMGDLPRSRVIPSRCFTNCGVDFTGHIELKLNKGRGVRTCKGYIAIFICMVTKAVHLELVSDLSTETFLAAFKRMSSRRGQPKHMYSDNGTNFVGAAKVLQQDLKLHETFTSPEFHDNIEQLQVEWHFNAPLWPTAGGLWESAVKSMKYHLRRVVGEQKLTYEQYTTLLTQVESCMNSRPLCALTEDIEDLEVLTPGHFLIGGPIMSLPHGQGEEKINLRNRWKLIEQMNIHFWKCWSQDYLHQMQERGKWQKPTKNLKLDDVVLIKENNLAPGRWALGRIIELHPGGDNYVRVATLKTKTGVLKRPITKLVPLPLQENTTLLEKENNNKDISNN